MAEHRRMTQTSILLKKKVFLSDAGERSPQAT